MFSDSRRASLPWRWKRSKRKNDIRGSQKTETRSKEEKSQFKEKFNYSSTIRCVFAYRPHCYNRKRASFLKRIYLKTRSRVETFENGALSYQCGRQAKTSWWKRISVDGAEMFQDAPSTMLVAPLITVVLALQIFFEGVQECIAAGVKEDEVGYQLAFSKQELRKCIKEYPAKELKKGLEQLYKKVEKHLCEEENLLQVRW